jgi:ABC-type uncharacterized transport system substrate-binding protein
VISRRPFVAGAVAVLVAPSGAQAQPAGKVYRIGLLRNGPPPETFMEGLRRGLRELGYIEGQNVSIEYGVTERADQLANAAAHLLRLDLDVLLVSGTPPVAKRATQTLPIVFVASIDPVSTGIVASLAPARREHHRVCRHPL